jgi:hypothetical protein
MSVHFPVPVYPDPLREGPLWLPRDPSNRLGIEPGMTVLLMGNVSEAVPDAVERVGPHGHVFLAAQDEPTADLRQATIERGES